MNALFYTNFIIMKKNLFISILLFFSVLLYAQKKYTSEQIRAAYEGTWKYENTKTQEVFILTLLYKPTSLYNSDEPAPYFIGFFSYSKNGKVIEDNLDRAKDFSAFKLKEDIDSEARLTIPISGAVAWHNGQSLFKFRDGKLGKIIHKISITAQVFTKNNKTLLWTMPQSDEDEYLSKKEIPNANSTIPMKMTLTRVK